MSTAYTREQLEKALESANAEHDAAKLATAGGTYNITTADFGRAFVEFVAQTRALMGNVNIKFTMPCGSNVTVKCLADARGTLERRINPKPRKAKR